MEIYFCFRSSMTEALEWLIEHQDDSDDEEDFLFVNTMMDTNSASSSSSMDTKKKFIKDACLELFETGNPCIRLKCILLFEELELKQYNI